MAYVSYLVGEDLSIQDGSLKIRVEDVYDAVTARALAWAFCPVISAGLLKQDITVTNIGYGIYDATVDYGTLPPRDDPSAAPTWSFDISTQSIHITHAKEHIETYPAGSDRDHKGAIGVRNDGQGGLTIEGTDVNIPVFTWEETHQLPYSLVSSYGWITTMRAMVAKINNAAFRIWAKGELLLLGVSGQSQGELACPVTFRFADSKTESSMTIGDITGVDKEGWHHLWVEYKKKSNSTALTNEPAAVHVERVYDYADFSLLGMPDPWN